MQYYLVFNSSGISVGNGVTPDNTLPPNAVICTEAQYQAWQSWSLASGNLAAATPPAPTLAQQAAAAIIAGLTITSTSAAALDGTYAVDASAQQHVMAEITSIMLNGTFADGSATVDWLDVEGASHTFTVAQFKTFATAISAYVAALTKCMLGQLAALPAATVTIP